MYMTPSNYALGLIMPKYYWNFRECLRQAKVEDGLSSSNCGGVVGGNIFAGEQSPLTFLLERSQ